MATSKDVAKLAAVSHTTVSRAFRGENIKKETYDKVMAAARQLNYSPNMVAANLRQRRTKTVGFLNSHGFNPLFLSIAQEMEQKLQENGYRMLISFDEGDFARQQLALQAMASAQVESIVFTPNDADIEMLMTDYNWLLNSKIHFIQLTSTALEGVCSFVFDDDYGALIGTRHLLAHGHRRILLVGGANRLEGFRQAYTEAGLACPLPYRDLTGKTPEESRRNIQEAMKQYQPTAIFSVAEPMNIATYEAVTGLGLRFPQDISLLMFDDAFWMQVLGISAIGHPAQAAAQSIVRQIVDCCRMDAGAFGTVKTSFRPFLVVRSSVKEQPGTISIK